MDRRKRNITPLLIVLTANTKRLEEGFNRAIAAAKSFAAELIRLPTPPPVRRPDWSSQQFYRKRAGDG